MNHRSRKLNDRQRTALPTAQKHITRKPAVQSARQLLFSRHRRVQRAGGVMLHSQISFLQLFLPPLCHHDSSELSGILHRSSYDRQPERSTNSPEVVKLTCSRSGDVSVIKVEDRMDAATCPDFEKACHCLLQDGEKLLVIDLGALVYISSAGLRSILVVGKRLKDTGGSLRVCGLSGVVKQVFDATGFTSIFPIFDSVDAAVK